MLPVQVRLVFAIEAQQQRVDRKASDPPASLNGPVLHVLGELQHLQPGLGVVAETQQAPQGEGELVRHTTSTPTHTHSHNQSVNTWTVFSQSTLHIPLTGAELFPIL